MWLGKTEFVFRKFGRVLGNLGRGPCSKGRLPLSPDPRPNRPLIGGRAGADGFGLAAVDSCAGSALVLTAQRVCWALAGAGWDENCCCYYLWQLRSSKLGLAAVLVYSCLSRRVCASSMHLTVSLRVGNSIVADSSRVRSVHM